MSGETGMAALVFFRRALIERTVRIAQHQSEGRVILRQKMPKEMIPAPNTMATIADGLIDSFAQNTKDLEDVARKVCTMKCKSASIRMD